MKKLQITINGKTKLIIAGIICISILELAALYKGLNGTLFTMVVAVIAAAVGVTIPTPKFLKQ